ncbi:DsrE family protein [Sphingomonas sp. C3-2]|uniref:DsrE family protein n=1 Tax=Sphingomonas sp. C3-2 TaxID=3062169 RepID=UPI00294AFEB2|nr:DsrE family protein [Sphingomonas sp. C3-2]WOK37258.1 DsrE family protein [Sphingomonas sp. C3-2]
MRGLTLLIATADADRFHAALSVGLASAATGARTRVYLHGDAVALAAPPHHAPGDARYATAGLPTLAQLLDEARALDMQLIFCQSGLALAGLEADALAPDFEAGGLVGLMAGLGEDRLLAF